jgi:ATP-binding cassette subfamily F protein uup
VATTKTVIKLSYKEKQELDGLPTKIERLESQQAELHERMADPDFYKQAPELIVTVNNQLAELESSLAELLQRWEELEARTQ